MSDTTEHDVKITRITSIACVAAFAVFIMSIAAYNINSTVFESTNVAAEADLIRAQAELETKQSDAIRDLIDNSTVNPIAARCTIIGWSGPEETTICALFIKDVNILRD